MLPKEPIGRPPRRQHAILNALWYVAVTGVQWRLLPREFPPWQTAYYHFRRFCRLGHWKRIHHVLRALVRAKMNRHKHPSAGCLDSQSVKTSAVAGARGFDSGKKVKGRKRHLLCDIRPKGTRFGVGTDGHSSQCFRLTRSTLGLPKNGPAAWCDQEATPYLG